MRLEHCGVDSSGGLVFMVHQEGVVWMDAQDENGLKKCFTAGVGVDVFEHKVLKSIENGSRG